MVVRGSGSETVHSLDRVLDRNVSDERRGGPRLEGKKAVALEETRCQSL